MVNVPAPALVGFLTISMLCLQFKDLVSFVFFLMPLSCGIPGYTFLIIYLILIFKGPTLTKKQFYPFFLVVLIELINEFFVCSASAQIAVLSFLSFTSLFFYFLFLRKEYYNLNLCLLTFAIGTSFTFFVIFFNMINLYGIESILTGMLRSGALGIVDNDITKMEGHLALNANELAYLSVCVFSYLFICYQKIHRSKLLIYFLMTMCLICGLLSFSRTFILCIICTFFLFVLCSNIRVSSKYIVFAFISSFVFILIFPEYVSEMFVSFSERGQDANMATAGGRTDLFSYYNKVWIERIDHIFLGAGVMSYYPLLHGKNVIHNGLQQIWVCLGIIGLIIYVTSIITYIKTFITKRNLRLLIPFIVTFLFDQSIQFLCPYPLMFPLMVSLLIIQLDCKNK